MRNTVLPIIIFALLLSLRRASQSAPTDCNQWDTTAGNGADFFDSPIVPVTIQRQNSGSGLHVSKTYDENNHGQGRIKIKVCSDGTGTNPANCRTFFSHYCHDFEEGPPRYSGNDKAKYADWDLYWLWSFPVSGGTSAIPVAAFTCFNGAAGQQ